MPLEPLAPLQGLGVAQPRARRRKSRKELTPEQEEGIARKVGRMALGGLSAGANFLDIPGSVVRDAVMARNPFDQLLSPFSDENRTTGREVTTRLGMTKPNDPKKWELSDFGGGVAEVALDPLTYLSFGTAALAKKGIQAAKAGTLAKGLKAGIEAGERGLVGVGLPFSKPAFVLGSKGSMLEKPALKVAGGLDKAAEAVRYGNIPGTQYSPGRHLAQAFDSRVKGMKTTAFQKGASRAHEAQTGVRARVDGIINNMVLQMHRNPVPGVDPGDIRQMRKFFEGIEPMPAQWQNIYDTAHKELKGALKESNKLGMETKDLGDVMNYFPRLPSASSGKRMPGSARSRVFGTEEASRMHRRWSLRGIPKGSDPLIALGQDTKLNDLIDSGGSLKDIAKYIKRNHGKDLPRKFQYRVKATGEMKEGNRYRALAKWLTQGKKGGFTREQREAGIFGNNPLFDLRTRLVSAGDRHANTKMVFDVLAEEAKKNPQWAAQANQAYRPGTVALGDIMTDLAIKEQTKSGGWVKQMARRLGIKGPLKDSDIELVKSIRINQDIAADATRAFETFKSPEYAEGLANFIDRITNLTKAGQTGPWPAFHVRNLISGTVRNAMQGNFSMKDANAARLVMAGKPVKDAASIPAVADILKQRGVAATPEAATDVLRELLAAHGLAQKFTGEASSRIGKTSGVRGTTFDDLLEGLPGAKQGFSFGKVAKEAVGATPDTTLNPLRGTVRGGLTDAAESTFGPVKAGEDIGAYVEHMNRAVPFINMLRKGYDPAEAAKRVLEAQVDYSQRNYTPFEQKWMQRLFPFYKFQKENTKAIAKELGRRPGGAVAQTVRGTSNAQGDEPEIMPPHVAESAAIPWQVGAKEGNKRYITSLGLMHEDPFQFVPSGGGLKGLGLEVASRMNPLVKGPAEYITGQSFFQRGPEGGRSADDLDPTLGRILANVSGKDTPVKTPKVLEQLLSNSPLSRAMTTARTATDRRKGPISRGFNLLTGAKVTDVSPQAQERELRNLLNKAIKETGGRTFSTQYLPEDILAEMTPEQRAAAEQYLALNQMLAQRAKGRKKPNKASTK
jgi:hypothetical protein